MEEQLSDNNKYWMRRLEDLELAHKKIDFVMEQEFDKAVSKIENISTFLTPLGHYFH